MNNPIMKKITLLFTIITLIVLVASCAGNNNTAVEPTPTPEVTKTAAPTQAPTPSPEPTPTPGVYSIKEGYSPTTGLPWDGKYKPIAVVVENLPAARPLSGLSKADWVYEIYVEGKITRLLAIFNDNMPEKVGPIRSARVNLLDIQQEWKSAFVHFGASEGGDATTCAKPRIPNLEFPFRADGVTGLNDASFWRDDTRNRPHNAYNNLVEVSKMFDADIEPVPHNFSETVMSGGTTCNKFSVAYNSSKSFVEYEFNAESNSYDRFVSGKEFIDRETDKQLQVTNIIIQRVDHTNPKVGSYTFEIMTLVGEGKAEYVMGGKHYTGTWKRDSINDKTYFYLDNGNEITLLPGNTWVQIVYHDTEVAITE